MKITEESKKLQHEKDIEEFYKSQLENTFFIDPRPRREQILLNHELGLSNRSIVLSEPPLLPQRVYPCILSTKEMSKNFELPCFKNQRQVWIGDETLDKIYERIDSAVSVAYEKLELHHLCLLFRQYFIDLDRFAYDEKMADLATFDRKYHFVTSSCSKCLEHCYYDFE